MRFICAMEIFFWQQGWFHFCLEFKKKRHISPSYGTQKKWDRANFTLLLCFFLKKLFSSNLKLYENQKVEKGKWKRQNRLLKINGPAKRWNSSSHEFEAGIPADVPIKSSLKVHHQSRRSRLSICRWAPLAKALLCRGREGGRWRSSLSLSRRRNWPES